MILADQKKLLGDIIEEKEYVDPNRLSIENLKEIGRKNYEANNKEKTMIDKMENDPLKKGLMMIEEGIKNEPTILQSNWNKLKHVGGDHQELTNYLSFLTGLKEKNTNLASKLALKLKSRKFSEKQKPSEQFEQYVEKEKDIMQQIAKKLED